MAYVIDIPANNAKRIIIGNKDDFEDVIERRMGTEFWYAYRESLAEWEYEHEEEILAKFHTNGDDYEELADGYLQILISTREELDAILSKKRIDRKALEMLYNKICNYT